ncbi:hypothetical protein pb186bvf_012771 [Paramecium bursaria]
MIFKFFSIGINQIFLKYFRWYQYSIIKQQIAEEPAQNVQHSQADLDFNINLGDEKKMAQMQSSQTTVAQPSQQVLTQPLKPQNASFMFQLFHMLFKGLAVAFYILLNVIIGSATITFVIIVLLDAFDFWTVKNVTGRKLVGLRWWSQINEDGTETWKYESMDATFEANECNSSVFWFTQLITTLVWLVFFIIEFLALSWLWAILALTGFILAGINLSGYYKCRGAHQKKAKEYMTRIGLKAMQQAM